MQKHTDHDLLDTVLTLRGHQITLRQAVAEGIIHGRFDGKDGEARIARIDAARIIERPDVWKSAG